VATVRAPEAEPASALAPAVAPRGEQTRARYPDVSGIARRAGGRIAWESYGQGEPPIMFVPPWQIVHSRIWKAQIPDFARRHRVIAWDARGNGRSDRPRDPAVLTTRARAADLGAVLDAAGIPAVVLVGLSSASGPMVVFAAENADRVLGLVFVCPAWPFGEPSRGSDVPFEDPLDRDDGWYKENIHFWRRDFRAYLEYFFSEAFPEPHSTKQREDGVDYALASDPETLAATIRAAGSVDPATFASMAASIDRPTLVIQGTDERISHVTQGIGLARAIPGARIELLEGGGHIPNARHPVRVNLLIREFVRALGNPAG
jgi:pimeloyl-ACP methyl ester carboxylesterase